MPRLAERHRVVVVDQRGQGASPAPDGGYDVRTRARDVAVLLRRLDVEQAAVVGTDLGGHTAFALALEAEQLVILLLPSAVVWVEHGTKATGAWTR